MGYYAMLVPAYTGHVNPMTALGRALQRRGHRVAIISPLDAEGAIRHAGLEFIPVAAVEFPRGEWLRTTGETGKLSGWKAARAAPHCLGRLARGILRDFPEIAAREQFDGLVMDQIAIGTEAAAEVCHVPLAVACNSLLLNAEPGVPPILFPWEYGTSWKSMARNVAGYGLQNMTGLPVLREVLPYRLRHRLRLMGLNHINLMPPSLVQVTQLPAFLDFPRRHLSRHFHYTGPWTEPGAREESSFPWERLDGRPLIYASLGTLQNRLEHVFGIIMEACRGLDAQLVLALGRKDAPVQKDATSGALVIGYAPQLELLERAALVITHGGLNTTLETLAQGLPLVALPITNDQPGVASRICHLGLGECIPIHEVSVNRLRETTKKVMHWPAYRERAKHFAGELRKTDGLSEAAELIEKAFVTRSPVLRETLKPPKEPMVKRAE